MSTDSSSKSGTAIPESGALVYERELFWQHSPDLLSIINMASATFDRVNPAWAATLGWSIDEMEGQAYETFVHPEDIGASSEAFARVRTGEPVLRFENRYRTKTGAWRWLRGSPFRKTASSTRAPAT